MPARRCDSCQRNYRPGTGRVHCPACGGGLSYEAKDEPDTPWPGEPLPGLTPEVEQEVAKGWDELKREADRRGLSLVDALEIGPSDKAA